MRAVLAHRQGDTETACALLHSSSIGLMQRQVRSLASAVGGQCGRRSTWPVAETPTRACHRLGRPACRSSSTRWPKIVLATGQAALAEHTGDRALAEAYFTQALVLYDDLPMPLSRARTLTDYGAFLTRGGEIIRGRVLLAEAFTSLRNAEPVGMSSGLGSSGVGLGAHPHPETRRAQPAGGQRRPARPGRPNQPGDRPAAPPVGQDGGNAPWSHLPETRHP